MGDFNNPWEPQGTAAGAGFVLNEQQIMEFKRRGIDPLRDIVGAARAIIEAPLVYGEVLDPWTLAEVERRIGTTFSISGADAADILLLSLTMNVGSLEPPERIGRYATTVDGAAPITDAFPLRL